MNKKKLQKLLEEIMFKIKLEVIFCGEVSIDTMRQIIKEELEKIK